MRPHLSPAAERSKLHSTRPRLVPKFGVFGKHCLSAVSGTTLLPERKLDVVVEEAPESELEVLNRTVAMLRERLPAGWTANPAPQLSQPERYRPDALIELRDVDGRAAILVLEVKRVVEGRDVEALREQLARNAETVPNGYGVVVARYLSPPVRDRLRDAGLSYVDATGNARVAISSPGLFLSDRGADGDPWRGPGRPRGTLKGAPAAKVVRALADCCGPWNVRALVEEAKASTGATYRVIEFLESEGLVVRGANNLIEVRDWVEMIRRWSRDYEFARTNQLTRWIAPRGLSGLMGRLAASDRGPRYAMTGSLAAQRWAAYAPARLAMIYVTNPAEAAEAWGLRAADAGANVLLAESPFDVVFERTQRDDGGVVLAAPAQVAVDLMTGPGRNPSEAEELVEWMTRNEQSWRLRTR